MPTTMTNAEMTAFLNDDAAARAEARTLKNIARRASTLFEDGYTALPLGHGRYVVTSPAKEMYSVFVSDTPDCEVFGSYCTCPCFIARKTCKHLQAVVNAIEEGAEGDALAEADDDRYPEF